MLHLDWNEILGVVIKGALSILFLTIIPAAIKWLPKLPAATQHALDWLQAHAGHAKNTYVAGLLQRVITLAGQKVLMLEQTEIAFLQQQAAAGKITQDQLPAMLAAVKQKAIDAVMADVKSQGFMEQLVSVFTGSQDGMTKWLSDVVESQVAQLPSSGMKYARLAPKA